MANNENLKNLRDRTPEERRAIAAKGGRASGEKRNFKSVVKRMMNENDNYERVVEAIFQQAIEEGNVQAATWLRDTAGEKPVEERRDQVDGNIEIMWKQ